MKNIKNAIDTLRKNKPTLYIGGGYFQTIVLKGGKKYTQKEIKNKLKEEGVLFKVPKDYIEFMEYSDGIGFFKDGGLDIFSLDLMINVSEAHEMLDKNMLFIGYSDNSGDMIGLDCNIKGGDVFISESCSDEHMSLNMTFETFMETLLKLCGVSFWRMEIFEIRKR